MYIKEFLTYLLIYILSHNTTDGFRTVLFRISSVQKIIKMIILWPVFNILGRMFTASPLHSHPGVNTVYCGGTNRGAPLGIKVPPRGANVTLGSPRGENEAELRRFNCLL
jgi:hypothetical protein